jgi:hypothetical protein
MLDDPLRIPKKMKSRSKSTVATSCYGSGESYVIVAGENVVRPWRSFREGTCDVWGRRICQ